MNTDFLPLGSIVLLKEAKRSIVIIGYTVVEEGSTKIWDYLGCAYPMGVIDPTKNLLFNKDQIEKVLFTGFIDEEGKEFRTKLVENLKKIKNE